MNHARRNKLRRVVALLEEVNTTLQEVGDEEQFAAAGRIGVSWDEAEGASDSLYLAVSYLGDAINNIIEAIDSL